LPFVIDEGLSPTFLARMQALPPLVTEWADGAQPPSPWQIIPATIRITQRIE